MREGRWRVLGRRRWRWHGGGKVECGAGAVPSEAWAAVGVRAKLQPCEEEREKSRMGNKR